MKFNTLTTSKKLFMHEKGQNNTNPTTSIFSLNPEWIPADKVIKISVAFNSWAYLSSVTLLKQNVC